MHLSYNLSPPPSCFSFKAYTSEVFSQKLDLLIARLASTAQANSSSGGSKAPGPLPAVPPPAAGVVDLHDLMYRFTLDTFSRIGFGVDPGCLATPGKIPFAQAFDRAQVVSGWEERGLQGSEGMAGE